MATGGLSKRVTEDLNFFCLFLDLKRLITNVIPRRSVNIQISSKISQVSHIAPFMARPGAKGGFF